MAKGNMGSEEQQRYQDNVGCRYVSRATLRNGQISPRKARLVLDLIKGMDVDAALQSLKHRSGKGPQMVRKVLQSALENARQGAEVDVDQLEIAGAWADMGRTLKRHLPRAQGRATPLRKRSSHITICLGVQN